MMKVQHFFAAACLMLSALTATAQDKAYTQVWSADKGNGTFVNPVINGDFPDIDVIRVEDTYYMVSTTMYHFPGATILKSKDLVNWEYCANPLKQILDNDAYNLMNGKHHYSQGMWASSLTYHDGQFYLYFPCSTWSEDSQSILLTTEDPEGEWKVTRLPEAYHDPGWLFDDGEKGDGFLYVACGIGDIWVNKFNAKTLKKISSERVISVGNGCEGSHMYHIGDYYYIYATYGGTEGSQTIFRSKKPMGPYEEHKGRVFEKQHIHQGALIETQTGEWWTMLFKDAGAIGRIPYLEPVKWVNGWPVIGNNGIDVSKNGTAYKKPNVGKTYEKKYLPTNDAFNDAELGMQWEWNHNPDNSAWSLTERPGYLRLYTANVTSDLNTARNSLSQRILGYSPNDTPANQYKSSYGTVKMELSAMQEGDRAGLAVVQNPYSLIGVKVENGKKMLYSERCTFNNQKPARAEQRKGPEVTADVIYLRAVVNFGTNNCRYYYSYDNKKWTSWGVTMSMGYTLDFFVGQRFYLFNYATEHLGGYVDFDWFTTEQDFSEEMFGIAPPSNSLTDDDLMMVALSIEQKSVEMLAGGVKTLSIICTAKSGLQRNVAADCSYTFTKEDIAEVKGGRILALKEGETEVTATYDDGKGNKQSVTFCVKAMAFPLTKALFNPSIGQKGSFVEVLGSLTSGNGGVGGWVYESGADFSKGKYLVVRFKRTPSTTPTFCLYNDNNTQSTPYTFTMPKQKEVIIDLNEVKNAQGKSANLSRIYIAGFSMPANATIYLEDVFLSDDGNTPVSVGAVEVVEQEDSAWYDLQGRPIRQSVQQPIRGIYIRNGKKVFMP